MKREHIFAAILAAIAIALFYLFNKRGLLHESVSTTIGNVRISGAGTIASDPVTGFPVYDTRVSETIPESEAFAIPPLDSFGKATNFPTNPMNCTCPIGYSKWKNAADNSIWCLPDPGTGTAQGAPLAPANSRFTPNPDMAQFVGNAISGSL